MYYCENEGCGKLTKPGEPRVTYIAEKRQQEYRNMVKKPHVIRKKIFKHGKVKVIKKFVKNKRKNAKKIEKVSKGWEIIKEVPVCRDCAHTLGVTATEPAKVVSKPKKELKFREEEKAQRPWQKKWQKKSNKKPYNNRRDNFGGKPRVQLGKPKKKKPVQTG